METLLLEYKKNESALQNTLNANSKLITQKTECEMLLEELSLAEEDAVIYKLVGPVLIKLPLCEAMQNANKRLEYIGEETKRITKVKESLQKELQNNAENIRHLQEISNKKTDK